MKSIVIALTLVVLSSALHSQGIAPAEKGTTYGNGTTATGSIPVQDLDKHIKNNRFEGKITGKVTEVCQEKGCWMKIEKADGEKLMVKFKDYAYFMPKNIEGKEVVLEGETIVKEVSVKQLQHYAKDAGKSEEEIKKITSPKKETQFIAKGVLVL